MKTIVLAFSAVLLLSVPLIGEGAKGEQWFYILEEANNPSREGALTEQESSWNVWAESPFAKGLRQFTTDTANWLEMGMCSHLGPADVFNPEWSLRCGVIYAEYLEKPTFGDYCNTRHIAEMRYNGGYWIVWELNEANSIFIKDAEEFCGTRLANGRKRSFRSCIENYSYPDKISERQNKYLYMGGKKC